MPSLLPSKTLATTSPDEPNLHRRRWRSVHDAGMSLIDRNRGCCPELRNTVTVEAIMFGFVVTVTARLVVSTS
jgi:hypothetical protein